METLTAQFSTIKSLPAYDLAASLPLLPGVYLFYDRHDRCIYIGKSIQIRKRVMSHFSARRRHRKEALLATLTHRIDYHLTAGDVGARLLENRLIKSHLPIYNRRQRRNKQPLTYRIQNDKLSLIPVTETEDLTECFGLFGSHRQAQQWLSDMCKLHQLCEPALLNNTPTARCLNSQLGTCAGICQFPIKWQQHRRQLKKAEAGLVVSKLLSAILECCQQELSERFLFDNVARFSPSWSPQFLAEFSLNTRRIRTPLSQQVSQRFAEMCQQADFAHAPRVPSSHHPELIAKLDECGTLQGHLPQCDLESSKKTNAQAHL